MRMRRAGLRQLFDPVGNDDVRRISAWLAIEDQGLQVAARHLHCGCQQRRPEPSEFKMPCPPRPALERSTPSPLRMKQANLGFTPA